MAYTVCFREAKTGEERRLVVTTLQDVFKEVSPLISKRIGGQKVILASMTQSLDESMLAAEYRLADGTPYMYVQALVTDDKLSATREGTGFEVRPESSEKDIEAYPQEMQDDAMIVYKALITRVDARVKEQLAGKPKRKEKK